MAKYCENCGREIRVGDNVCSGCGSNLNNPNLNRVDNSKSPEKYANNALTFGLISLIAWIIPLFGYPITIIAIYNACKGMNAVQNKNKAIIGLILGIIFLLVTLCNSIAGVLMNLQVY